jgi:hypothetical protein
MWITETSEDDSLAGMGRLKCKPPEEYQIRNRLIFSSSKNGSSYIHI